MKSAQILGVGSCIIDALMWGLKAAGEQQGITSENIHFFKSTGSGHREISESLLADAGIIIVEAAPWKGYSALTELEMAKVSASCAVLKVPTLHFNSLWPALSNDPRNKPEPDMPWGKLPFARSDRLAINVLKKYPYASTQEKLEHYKASKLSDLIDIERNHQFEIINMIDREEGCDVKIAAFVLSEFRNRQLFYMHHHPTQDLLLYIMAQLLMHPALKNFLGDDADAALRAANRKFIEYQFFIGEDTPIHPEVAHHFGLKWWSRDMVYHIAGVPHTFEEWIESYLGYQS